MSMDERQVQIKERAGLDESRLNQDFIDWLKKWGPYALFALSAVAGIYFLVNYRAKAAAQAMDQAFVELDAALLTKSPASLVAVADTQSAQGAAPFIARLAAADVHLEAFRTGVPSGVTVDRDGKLPADKALLTDEQRQQELKSAESLFQAVVDGAGSGGTRVLELLSGLNGLAAVAESRGETDKAKGLYQRVIDTARAAKLDGLADAAKKRIDSLGALTALPKLYAKAELPGQPADAAPVMMGGGMMGTTADGKQIPLGAMPTITGSDGKPIQLQPLPAGFTPPGMKPEGGAAPAPAPAPAPSPAPAPAPAGEQPKNP